MSPFPIRYHYTLIIVGFIFRVSLIIYESKDPHVWEKTRYLKLEPTATQIKRESDNSNLEYYSLFSSERNQGRNKTAVVIFHDFYQTGYTPCRSDAVSVSNLLKEYEKNDITLICPSAPGKILSMLLPCPKTQPNYNW